MLPKTIEVPFHGDTLLTVEQDGQPFVAIKPICERFGMDWKSQHRKLTDPNNDWGIYLMTIPTKGGLQEMTCLSLMDFPLWLASISPAKVREDVRATLKRYRQEAKQVLFDHFITRQKQSEEALKASQTHLLAQYPRWAKIVTLIKGGASEYLVYKRSNMPQQQFEAELQEMERCGLVDASYFVTGKQETLLEERNRLRMEKLSLNQQVVNLKARLHV